MPSERVVRTTGPEPSLTVYPSRVRQVLPLSHAELIAEIAALRPDYPRPE